MLKQLTRTEKISYLVKYSNREVNTFACKYFHMFFVDVVLFSIMKTILENIDFQTRHPA